MNPISPLAYHVPEVLSPQHRIGRWVAKWISIACATQAAGTLVSMMGDSQTRAIGMTSNTFYRRGYYATPSWQETYVSFVKIGVCLGAFAVILTGMGVVMRGRMFRRRAVAAMGCYAIVLLAGKWFPMINLGQEIYTRMVGGGKVISTDLWITLAAGTLGRIGEVLLPLFGLIVLSRKWVAEALTAGEAEATGFGIRLAAVVAMLSGIGGIMSTIVYLFLLVQVDSREIRDYVRMINFNVVWTYASMIALSFCSVLSIIGGIRMLKPAMSGVRMVLWQARVSVIVNAVNVFFLVAFTVIAYGFGPRQSGGLPAAVVTRMLTLSIDVILWLYLGSRAVATAVEEINHPHGRAFPVSAVALFPQNVTTANDPAGRLLD